MMQVRVLAFGVLKEALGGAEVSLELRDGATVADLLTQVAKSYPKARLQGIAVGVNAEYANAGQVLRANDEVGLLPPVSGGSPRKGAEKEVLKFLTLDAVADDYENFEMIVQEVSRWARDANFSVDSGQIAERLNEAIEDGDIGAFTYQGEKFVSTVVENSKMAEYWFLITEQGKRKLVQTDDFIALTRDVIDAAPLVAAAKRGEDGAVVVFDGIVRDNSRGRKTVHLDYEAYEEMAVKQMGELASQAREKFGVRHVTIVHRLGRLLVGESSVLIVVSSAHRGQAFGACRWIIDTLKKTVPVWKKETFVDGAVWADGEPFPEGVGLEAKDAS